MLKLSVVYILINGRYSKIWLLYVELVINDNKSTWAKCGVWCIRLIEKTQYTMPEVYKHDGMITKLMTQWDLQRTWLVVLVPLVKLNPIPTLYYATPNELCN